MVLDVKKLGIQGKRGERRSKMTTLALRAVRRRATIDYQRIKFEGHSHRVPLSRSVRDSGNRVRTYSEETIIDNRLRQSEPVFELAVWGKRSSYSLHANSKKGLKPGM